MIKKYLIVLMLLLFSGSVYANLNEGTQIIRTDINITIRGYSQNNLSYVNISIVTEDGTLTYDRLSSDTDTSQIKNIGLIRTLECSKTDIVNLTNSCIGYFNTACEGKNCVTAYLEYKDANTRCANSKSKCDASLVSCTDVSKNFSE